jgi:hypothetical protein
VDDSVFHSDLGTTLRVRRGRFVVAFDFSATTFTTRGELVSVDDARNASVGLAALVFQRAPNLGD